MKPEFIRTASIASREPDAAGLYDFAIASEVPYERWWGIEILGCQPGECNLERLGDGRHPLLLNHCTDDQIGVVASAYLQDAQLRGKCKFSRGVLGAEIEQDMQDGIRNLVSVGYFIEEVVELVPPGEDEPPGEMATDFSGWVPKRTLTYDEFAQVMRAKHGESWSRAGQAASRGSDSQPEVYRVTKWTPFEASVVAVPADASVGFDRSAGSQPDPAQAAKAAPAAPTPTPILLEVKTMSEVIAKTPAELEAERQIAIISLGTQYAKYLGPNDTADAVRNRTSVDQFRDLIMQKLESRHVDISAAAVGMTVKEVRRYSLSKALLAQMTGDWSQAGLEREASAAMASVLGRAPEGFYIPADYWAQRDFNIGTGSEAGNLKATELRTDLFTDYLRNKLVLGRMGVRVLTGLTSDVAIPRKTGVSTIGTTSEVGSASETNPNTALVTLAPKRQTAYVEVSKQALIQSGLALEPMIRDDLVQGVAVQIESQVFNGTGTAPQMTGIRYTSSIGTVAAGSNGGTVSWANLVDLESACANANAEPDQLAGYIINTKTRGATKKVQKGTNQPFLWDGGDMPLNGYRVAVTNNLPSNLTKGTSTTVCSAALFSSDWSMQVLGFFGGVDVTVDPYSKADTGQVKITVNAFADTGCRLPGAFAKCEDLLT